jgi:hypothetical protein
MYIYSWYFSTKQILGVAQRYTRSASSELVKLPASDSSICHILGTLHILHGTLCDIIQHPRLEISISQLNGDLERRHI